MARFTHHKVTAAEWSAKSEALAHGERELLALFGDDGAVRMVSRDPQTNALELYTVGVEGGRYPSVSAHHAPALRLERAIHDLFGYEPVGLPDTRPWLDHGAFDVSAPLGAKGMAKKHGTYEFLPAEGEGLHQIPVGPVHAGIIEPGHFRFTANGETVVRLEQRLGYVHKGVESLMAGAPIDRAAQLSGRISGDSTVAYQFAFARAAEDALDIQIPARATQLRAVMAELERIANHLGDFGAVCNDASYALIHAHCGILREQVLQVADFCFGHRLMRDVIVPGGIARDVAAEGVVRLRELVREVGPRFRELYDLYDSTPSLLDRTVTTGAVAPALVRHYSPGGYVGRASARDFDARRDLAYAPYDKLTLRVPQFSAGDVDARVRVRAEEIEVSLALISQLLGDLPPGEVRTALPSIREECEALAVVEGFRGDILVYLRLNANGTVARCHPRDPSWFQWPLLEAAIEDNIVADFPLCNKSFNCSYSGHDL